MSAVGLGLRAATAVLRGYGLAHRPAGRVHLVPSPSWTPSGRYLAKASRTLCGTRHRRLSRLSPSGPCVDLGGRRFCRGCTSRLTCSPGRDVQQLVSRDDWLTAYADLTVDALRQALTWSYTVDETHTLGRLALMVLGPAPIRPATPEQQTRRALDDQIVARRRVLAAAALSPEDRAAREAAEKAKTDTRTRLAAQARKERQIAKAIDRRTRGQHLMPYQRALLDSA